jgi:hypothetical protein
LKNTFPISRYDEEGEERGRELQTTKEGRQSSDGWNEGGTKEGRKRDEQRAKECEGEADEE